MAYPWFKFYGAEYLSDAKMDRYTAAERGVWLTILCMASVSNTPGTIINTSEERILTRTGVLPTDNEWEQLHGTLWKFENDGMISVSGDKVKVKNWERRQDAYATWAEKKRRYREGKEDKSRTSVSKKSPVDIEEDTDLEGHNTCAPKRARVKKKAEYTTLGADVLKAFEDIDPKNKTYYANKTQRAAADFLVSEHGLDKVLAVIKLLPKTNNSSFFPTITSANDLKEKWTKLGAALVRKKGESTSKGRGLA